MTFLGDEGRDALVMYEILHGNLTLLGPTSSVGGFFLGPIYYYLAAPFFLLFNYSPVGPSVMVALLSVATVWLMYKIGKEFFNKRVGLIAAFFYSISPLVINYSHSSWNPNVLPISSLLTLYVVYIALKRNSWRWFILIGFLLGIGMQLHYLVIFLCVVVFFYILLARLVEKIKSPLKILLKEYFLIFIGFIIGWSPFLLFEARHEFRNIKNIFEFVFKSGETGGNSHFFQTIGDVFFKLFGRLIFSFPQTIDFYRFDKLLISFWYYAVLIFALFSLFLLIKNLIKTFKTKDFSKYSLLFVWLIIGVGLFGFYKKNIYDYYFQFMFPLPFFLSALTMNYLYEKKNILLKLLTLFIFVSVVIAAVFFSPLRSEPNRQFLQMKTIADFVISKTDNRPYNFALITGGNSDFAYRYFFTVWNKKPVEILNPQLDPKRTSVTNQLLIVCESFPCKPLGHSLWEIAGFGRAEIAGEWNVSVVKVFKLQHYKGK